MDLGSSWWVVGVWSNVGVAAEEIVFLRQSVIASWSGGGGGGRRVSGEDRNTNTTAGGKTGDVSVEQACGAVSRHTEAMEVKCNGPPLDRNKCDAQRIQRMQRRLVVRAGRRCCWV